MRSAVMGAADNDAKGLLPSRNLMRHLAPKWEAIKRESRYRISINL